MLRAWVANLEASWDRAVHLAGPARTRIWRLYMAAEALNFEAGCVQVHQILAVRADGGHSSMHLRPTFETTVVAAVEKEPCHLPGRGGQPVMPSTLLTVLDVRDVGPMAGDSCQDGPASAAPDNAPRRRQVVECDSVFLAPFGDDRPDLEGVERHRHPPQQALFLGV